MHAIKPAGADLTIAALPPTKADDLRLTGLNKSQLVLPGSRAEYELIGARDAD